MRSRSSPRRRSSAPSRAKRLSAPSAGVLAGPLVEDAVENALTSPAIERALANALDSEMVDHLWEQLLNSNEVQQLFERIGDAPELRAAMAAQGAGLVEDVGRGARNLTRRLDDVVERALRRALSRSRRQEPTSHVGLVTRGLAFLLDASIINIGFLVLSGLVAFLATTLLGDGGGASTGVLVTGAGAWVVAGALYLASFWALAGQTPGMRFLGIRLESGGERRIGVRRAIRRLFGLCSGCDPSRTWPSRSGNYRRPPRLAGPHRAYRRAVHNQLILISSTSASCTTRCAHQPGVGAAARWSCW